MPAAERTDHGVPVDGVTHVDPRYRPAHAMAPATVARFSRHLLLPQVGAAGQAALLAARVLLVSLAHDAVCDATLRAAATALTASGVQVALMRLATGDRRRQQAVSDVIADDASDAHTASLGPGARWPAAIVVTRDGVVGADAARRIAAKLDDRAVLVVAAIRDRALHPQMPNGASVRVVAPGWRNTRVDAAHDAGQDAEQSAQQDAELDAELDAGRPAPPSWPNAILTGLVLAHAAALACLKGFLPALNDGPTASARPGSLLVLHPPTAQLRFWNTENSEIPAGAKGWIGQTPFEADAPWPSPRRSPRGDGYRVLVVGAGGIGSGCLPAMAQLLAGDPDQDEDAAAVPTLGIVDDDTVALHNLHRQTLHTRGRIGVAKVDSAIAALTELLGPRRQDRVRLVAHRLRLTAANALALFGGYDVVLDASDNAPTRYLISDACVALGLPLVSASAVRWEGHVTIYHGPRPTDAPPPSGPGTTAAAPLFPYPRSPCYRCLYPVPPPPATMTSCDADGVMGPVPGLIGALAALATWPLLTHGRAPLAGQLAVWDTLAPRVRTVRLRPAAPDCPACAGGQDPGGAAPGRLPAADYAAFCGMAAAAEGTASCGLALVPPAMRVAWEQLLPRHGVAPRPLALATWPAAWPRGGVLDVRPPSEVAVGTLPSVIAVPLATLAACATSEDAVAAIRCAAKAAGLPMECDDGVDDGSPRRAQTMPWTLVCRRGNDSQRAVVALQQLGFTDVKDVPGGLTRWAAVVDPHFPIY